MRILHLTHTDIRFDNRIIKEIEALSAIDDYNVCGIGMAFDEGSAENSLSHIPAKIVTLSVLSKKAKYLPRVLRHCLIFAELLVKIFRLSNKFKPDVVHCHDTLVLPIGWLIKIVNGKAILIYDAHELESNKNGQSFLLSRFTLMLEKLCWKKIDLLITVSPSIEKWYHEKLGSKMSLIVLNSPALSADKKNNIANSTLYQVGYFQEKFSIPNDRYIYIYVGALTQGRCIDLMLAAFSDDRIKSHIVFVGFGPLKDKIIKSAEECSNIHFHEAVPHDFVVDLVKNADIGMCLIENISLSDYYSLPNKLFEYSFSGLSVLGSSFPDIKDVIDRFQLGQYCNIDYDSILKVVLETEAIPKVPRPERDLKMLSWENQAMNLRNIYVDLSDEKKVI